TLRIDDRQPAVDQCSGAGHVRPGGVGPSAGQRLPHRLGRTRHSPDVAPLVNPTGNPTHELDAPPTKHGSLLCELAELGSKRAGKRRFATWRAALHAVARQTSSMPVGEVSQ